MRGDKKQSFIITVFVTTLCSLYKYCVSPFLGNNCRYYPSCSEYWKQAVLEHGLLKGCALGVYRLLRCHPLCEGGVDHVPSKKL